jgi:hypothetical protein
MAHLTVPAQTPRVQHVGNGVTTDFSFPFPIVASSDLAVSIGTVLAAGYTVTGAGQTAGGSIVFGAPPSVGEVITIVRARPYARTTDFADAGEWRAATVNDELDSLAMQTQQLATEVARSVRMSQTAEGSPDLTLPTLIPDRVLMVNATATGMRWSSTNPDTTTGQATAAAASAAAAAEDAAAAADAASAAQAAAESAGATSKIKFTITLVEGQHQYELPSRAAAAVNVDLQWGRGVLEPGVHYTIGDANGPGMTLVLLENGVNTGAAAVSADGDGWKHEAGQTYWGVVSGAIIDTAIGRQSIDEINMKDDAVSARTVIDRNITGPKIALNAIAAEHVAAKALPVSKLDLTGTPRGALLTADASGNMAALGQGSTYQFPRSTGTGEYPIWTGVSINMGSRQMLQAPVVSEHAYHVPGGAEGVIQAIDLWLDGVQLSGAENVLLQVGTGTGASPSWVTSGYTGRTGIVAGSLYNAITTGFVVGQNTNTLAIQGPVFLRRQYPDTNTWIFFCDFHRLDGSSTRGHGSIALPDGTPLKQIRIIAAGSNTFSAGHAFARAMS